MFITHNNSIVNTEKITHLDFSENLHFSSIMFYMTCGRVIEWGFKSEEEYQVILVRLMGNLNINITKP